MKKAIIVGTLTIIVLSVTVGLFAIAIEKGVFNVDIHAVQIEIVTDQGVSPAYRETLVAAIQPILRPLHGVKLWEIPMGTLVRKVQEQPWVQHMSIERVLPNQVQIQIQVKAFSLGWVSSKAMITPIADDASLMPNAEFDQILSSSLVLSRDRRVIVDEDLRKKLVHVLTHLPADGSFSRASVSEVEFSPANQIWLTLTRDQSRVHLGEENLEIRASRVAQVLNYLEQNNFSSRVIDADFSKKVLVRLRNRH